MPTWFVDDPETFIPPTGRAGAHLVILSETVSASDLVEIVGTSGDTVWNKGDRPHTPGRFSGLSIASRLPETAAPADHLTDLLLRIEPIAATVRALIDDERIASVRVWLVHHLQNWNPGFSISADQLHRLDQIGTGLEIDAYVEEEEATSEVTSLADQSRPTLRSATLEAMADIPDWSRVWSRDDLLSFIRALMLSFDHALTEPMPAPYVDERGGWTNWTNRYDFWEAMTAWLEDTGRMRELSTEPIAEVMLERVDEPAEEAWNDSTGLRDFLHSVEAWAAAASPDQGSPQMWRRAARALTGGVVYE